MWLIGIIVGAILGAKLHGFSGAMWGAIIGWVIGLLLGRNAASASQAVKDTKIEQLEKRLVHVQKAVEDIHWRLNSLEAKPGAPELPAMPPTSSGPAQALAMTHPETMTEPAPIGPPYEPANSAGAQQATSPPPVEPVETAVPTPMQPSLIERLLEGNIVAKLGVVILFFGVGFLLKFAYDRGVFPPEMRLLGVAAASAVMFFIGLRLLESKRTYALILFGGAMGLLYLDVFFALKTFAIISAPVGFLFFAALGIATLVLAVKLDARAFATLGLLGAFLAPILLLNLVILGASWFKAWRELNLVGFLFTFAIALFWGFGTYQSKHFATVEPFLIAFFLLYLAIPILFAQRQQPKLKGLVDGTLVFGVPLSAAMLQAALTHGMGDKVLAWSALAAALVYATLAWALWSREKMRLLAEAHLALAIVFATVAPYFAFHGYPTFAFWTLEGAAIFWVGCRQKSTMTRAFALCLQLAAAAYFWLLMHDANTVDPWSNDREFGCALIAAAALLTAWFMHRFEAAVSKMESSAQPFVIAWACLWWFAALQGIIESHVAPLHHVALQLTAVALSILVFELTGRKFAWPALRRTQVLLTLAMAIAAVYLADNEVNPFMGAQFFAWLLAFVISDVVLARQENDGAVWQPGMQHVALFNLGLLLLAWELCWRAQDAGLADAWRYAGIGLTAAFGLAVATFGIARNHWPFARHALAIRWWSLSPLLIASLLWTLIANIDSSGAIAPLPYLPILNPIDLTQLALFAGAVWAMRAVFSNEQTENGATQTLLLFAAAGFFWVNAALLRTVHHWTGVPFELSALLHSVIAQAALSLVWTATALVMMWTAAKRREPSRSLWMAGALLLGIVVLKLFFNDLGNTGTIARIVSFIGVGVLLMVIGYVAPVPPKVQESVPRGM
jgi:uncharacterized membrane protein